MKKNIILFLLLGLLFVGCSALTPLDENPDWLSNLITKFENEPTARPAPEIWRYYYKNQIVYYFIAPCCDQYNILYDSTGNFLGYPDGGWTGKGDGKFPDFFTERKNGTLIWKAKRNG